MWTQNTVKYNDFNPELNYAVKDTIVKIGTFRQYNLEVSLGTTIYGTYNCGENKKIQSIKNGVLGDIAPTILELMGVEQPKEMTRKSLL